MTTLYGICIAAEWGCEFAMSIVFAFLRVNLAYMTLQYKHNMRILSGNMKCICTRQRLIFLPVSKARTNKFYSFRQCMYIVYLKT
jgi:hypothetical protein